MLNHTTMKPNPDYFLLWMWTRFVGTAAFATKTSGDNDAGLVRAYTFEPRRSVLGADAAAVVLVINVDATAHDVVVVSACAAGEVYSIGSATGALGADAAALLAADGSVRTLLAMPLDFDSLKPTKTLTIAHEAIALPAYSYSFIVCRQ